MPLKYKYYDAESKKESVTSLLARLITVDKVNVTFSAYSSGLTLRGAPVAESHQMLYMDHGGANNKIFRQGFQYIVQTIGPASRYHEGTLDMIHQIDPKAKNVALAYEDSEFAKMVMIGAEAHAKKLGFNIVFKRTYVLVGGIIAAFLGPELAKAGKNWLPQSLYTGSFAALAMVYSTSALLISFLHLPPAKKHKESGLERPLTEIVTQPLFITAVLAGLVAYGVMTFIMTATPVSMSVIDGFSLDETAWVIQSHIVAMFLPSLFSGILVDRFGLIRIMLVGIVCMIACVLIALLNHHFLNYWISLVLLGVGWNLLFVAGTALLTKCYRAVERFKSQAVNEQYALSLQFPNKRESPSKCDRNIDNAGGDHPDPYPG